MNRKAAGTIIVLLTLSAISLSGCELIGNIFKAGVWVGVILVVVIIALVIMILRKIF